MAEPRVHVRPASLGDHAALSSLWRELDHLHARLSPGFFAVPLPGRGEGELTPGELRRLLQVRDAVLLVGEISHQVVGCVRLELYDTPPFPGMLRRRRVYIERIIVGEASRRAGVGRRLMEAAAAWSQARGATQLVLTVWQGNEAAERFYASLGYLPISRMLGRDLP